MANAERTALIGQRVSLIAEIARLRDQVAEIDSKLALSDVDRVSSDRLTLVYAEPGAEKDNYGMWLAEVARVPFHGPVETAEDAARVAAAGPGAATIHADDGIHALQRFRALMSRALADEHIRVLLTDEQIQGLQTLIHEDTDGAHSIVALPVPDSRAAAEPHAA